MIELHGIAKRYGPIQALTGVTGSIDGSVIGLLGPNGAGKSTLIKVLLGLLSYDGEARVFGMSSRHESFAIRDRVGYMPERECSLPDMTAVELCTYAGELNGLPRRAAIERAHAALYYAGIEDKRYQKVETYSTGLKQRVKLAQALVHDPDLLLLDEPTNGLDPRARDEMLTLIAELPARHGCAVILSTHLLPDVERVCESVVIMQAGTLRFTGTLDALRTGARDDDSPQYDVEVQRDAGALADRLRAAGCDVATTPPLRLRVTVPADGDTRMIFREARGAGVQVRHLAPRTVSLEAAFLRELGVDP